MDCPTNQDIIFQCQQWVAEFVVKQAICPFAGPVIDQRQIDYLVLEDGHPEQQLQTIMGQVHSLQVNPEPETMLLILPTLSEDFDAFLFLADACNQLLADLGHVKDIQIATFHPLYLFEGEEPDAPSHFTNRSPWPMLHLLRQSSLSRVLANYPDPAQIPARNIELMHKMGTQHLTELLSSFQRHSVKPR